MSFQRAEISDPSLKGISDALQAALVEPAYTRNPHQIYDNMDSDLLIGPLPQAGMPASRIELLRQVSPHRADPSKMPDEVTRFCRANLQQGPGWPGSDRTIFGHVHGFESLVHTLTSPAVSLSLRNSRALLDDVVRGGKPTTRLERQRIELAEFHLSRYQMWSFPVGNSADPFREIGVGRGDAVNALGLGYYAKKAPDMALVRWAHQLPSGQDRTAPTARRPTAWDAGSDKGNAYWRPGGMTWRLDRDEVGVSEVVHDPIQGKNLVAAIEVLT